MGSAEVADRVYQGQPELSVIIPAHEEAGELPGTLDNLCVVVAELGVPAEIIVVDNASRDATATTALAHGARVVSERHRQIARARNTGARAARADRLLFVDADTWPAAELVARALNALDGGACGGGAMVSMPALPGRFYRWGLATWNALARRLHLAAGCFVFVRRDAFTAVGGFDERYYAGDEVLLSRQLARWGRRYARPFILIESPPVMTSARKAVWFSPLQHLATVGLVVLCPPAMRSRRLMWFWYGRPGA